VYQNDLFDPVPLDLIDDAESGIRYLPGVVSPATAQAWFEQALDGVIWSNQRRMMYEREVDVPRLMAHFSLDAAAAAAGGGTGPVDRRRGVQQCRAESVS
jgi:hypothetical protein